MQVKDFLDKHKYTIDKQVDITTQELLMREGLIQTYFPIDTYTDFDVMILRVRQNKQLAHIIGIDGEIPESKAGSMSMAIAQEIKIGRSHVYTESDMKLLKRWQENIRGIPDDVRDYFFGTAASHPQAILDTHNLLCVQLMYSGTINYTDPITEVAVSQTYPTESWQYPSALSGGARWNQATGNCLTNLRDHAREYRRRLGFTPDILINEDTVDLMLEQTAVKEAALARKGVNLDTAGVAAYDVSIDELQDLLDVRRAGTLRIFDEKYEDFDGVEQFFMPEGYYAFAIPDMGDSGLMPVPSNNMASGIYVFSEELSKEPPKDRTVGVANTAIVVDDIRRLAGRKVY